MLVTCVCALPPSTAITVHLVTGLGAVRGAVCVCWLLSAVSINVVVGFPGPHMPSCVGCCSFAAVQWHKVWCCVGCCAVLWCEWCYQHAVVVVIPGPLMPSMWAALCSCCCHAARYERLQAAWPSPHDGAKACASTARPCAQCVFGCCCVAHACVLWWWARVHTPAGYRVCGAACGWGMLSRPQLVRGVATLWQVLPAA